MSAWMSSFQMQRISMQWFCYMYPPKTKIPLSRLHEYRRMPEKRFRLRSLLSNKNQRSSLQKLLEIKNREWICIVGSYHSSGILIKTLLKTVKPHLVYNPFLWWRCENKFVGGTACKDQINGTCSDEKQKARIPISPLFGRIGMVS